MLLKSGGGGGAGEYYLNFGCFWYREALLPVWAGVGIDRERRYQIKVTILVGENRRSPRVLLPSW